MAQLAVNESLRRKIFFVGMAALGLAGLSLLFVSDSQPVGIALLVVAVPTGLALVFEDDEPGQDLRSGKVAVVQGMATITEQGWYPGRETYWFQVGDQTWQLVFQAYAIYKRFVPGNYRVYYAPHSRRLLSLEPADTAHEHPFENGTASNLSNAAGPITLRPLLRTVFDFTDEDLAANHQGQLSQRQRDRLKTQQLRLLILPLLLLLAMVIVLPLPMSSASLRTGLTVFLLSGVALSILLAVRQSIGPNKDLIAGDVFKAEGQPQFQKSARLPYTHRLDLNGQIFRISAFARMAFVTPGKYRLFYTPQSKRVLSAERIDEDTAQS